MSDSRVPSHFDLARGWRRAVRASRAPRLHGEIPVQQQIAASLSLLREPRSRPQKRSPEGLGFTGLAGWSVSETLSIAPMFRMAHSQTLSLSVIECFETDGGVNYRSDRLILF